MPQKTPEERTPLRPHVEQAVAVAATVTCVRNYWSQVIILALVAFGSRGMWSALNALGGAGTNEVRLVTIINVLFSASYCAFGWLGGAVVNLTGPRFATLSGAVSISVLMTFLYLYAFHRAVSAVAVVIAAVLDGVGSVFLWSATSYVLLFYPKPSERGKAMSVFNLIYNLGAVTGAVLTVVMNSSSSSPDLRPPDTSLEFVRMLESSSSSAMTSSSYLSIVLITYSACLLCGFLAHPSNVTPRLLSLSHGKQKESFFPIQELRALWFAATHKYTYLLSLFFVVTTWHIVVLFNWLNAGFFNVRSRAANSAIYWLFRILATFPLQFALDSKRSSMRIRGLRGFVLLFLAWISATSFMICICLLPNFTNTLNKKMDITEAAAIAPILAFAFFGAVDTIAQSFAIWIVGALPLDPPTAARVCGLFRSFQGFGQLLSWILDVHNFTPYRWQFAICTILWAAALVPLLIVILKHLDPFPEEPFALAEKEPVPLSARTTGRSLASI